jgi:vesicle-fusing ATPase
VRGLLLYGPPGTGKTLIARELAKVLNARPPKIVNGPELLDKYVGEAERNIRQLFAEADEEWDRLGLKSELHVIILDEVDSIAKRRGSSLVGSDGNGVRESVTNQLLAKIDGIKERNNVLVIGLTNRRDLLDPALLRPGRLEAQIEISGPSRQGRRDIMAILLRGLVKSAVLTETEAADVSERVAARTAGFTGAELAGVLRSAASFALSRLDDEHDDDDEGEAEGKGEGEGDGGDELAKIAFTLDDFQRGIDEVCSTKWKGMGKARQRLALLREWLSQRHKV